MVMRNLLVVLFQWTILTACGATPAFDENVTTRPRASDSSANGDADAMGKPGTNENSDNEQVSSDGANVDGHGDQGENGSSGEDDDGSSNQGDQNDDSKDPDGTPGSEILIEDGGTLDIPGEKAQRVGINFEDHTDFDYNDAVLCFEGNFKVEGTSVVSYQNQMIEAETFSASACRHRVDVVIRHEDGTSESFSYMSNTSETVYLPFRIKSRLEVTMTTIAGGCHRNPVTMHNTQYAIVKPNVCNNSGN